MKHSRVVGCESSAGPGNYDRALQALYYDSFFREISEPEHLLVSTLAPQVKAIYPLGESIAVREEQGVRQELKAIVRNGNHGFGLISAEGKGMPVGAFMFLAHLCTQPYRKERPGYVAEMRPGSPVELGKAETATSYLREEGRQITLALEDEGSTLSLQSLPRIDRLRSVFQLITTDRPLHEQPLNDRLKQEDYLWAPTPSFVRSLAVAINNQRRDSEKRPLVVDLPKAGSQPRSRIKPEERISSKVRRHRRRMARLASKGVVVSMVREAQEDDGSLIILGQ